ncbi:MAG TPA: hypothetical protein VLF66_15475 [Thermoanaerobaculia bacterium]|nr:hypothetical protein [Thermoanaerobaculia bacterium]
MPEAPQPSRELVERALSGADPRLSLLAAQGLLPIPPEELVPAQVALAQGDDPDLAGLATVALAQLPSAQVAGLVRHGAPEDVLVWFGRQSDDPDVLEAILRRRDVPRPLLAELARKLPASLQEVLLLRQDAILERPEILGGLEGNPEISAYSRRRILEFREHLLPRRGREEREVEPDEEGEASDEELFDALEDAHGRPLAGELDRQTGLTDAQIRTLPVPVRRRLAQGAAKSLRAILIRDPNPQVAVAAIAQGGLSDGEVEQVAANRSVLGDVLEEIARHREWVNKYPIVSNLVHNPRTPAGVAVRLLPRISVRELGQLARDHNVSSTVRTQAQRLYRMKRR